MREDIQKMIDDFVEEIKKEELNKEAKYEDFERNDLDFDVYELEFDNKQLESDIEIKNDINFELNTSNNNFEFRNGNITKFSDYPDLTQQNLVLAGNNDLAHNLNMELKNSEYEPFKQLESENYKFHSETSNSEMNIPNFDTKLSENSELKVDRVDGYLEFNEINVESNIPKEKEKFELPVDVETKTEIPVENKLDMQTPETEINLDRIDIENNLKEKELKIPSQNIDFENELSIPEVEITTSFNVPSEGNLDIKNANFLAENNFALPQISFKPEQQISYVIVKEIQTPVNVA
jgi:hypothetical protein